MGIYYFAVDYINKLQMWPPLGYANKNPGVFYPSNPFPCMIVMKNIEGYEFEIINDVASYDEHEFRDITEEAFKELKERFPDYEWKNE